MFGYKLVKKETDEDLLKELIEMMERTTKELIVERESLVKIGAVQKSITERLDHIEHFLDQLYGKDEEEDRIVN